MHATAYEIMRPNHLAHVRRGIGASLRDDPTLMDQPAPPRLMELLGRLETRVRRDTTRDRLFADVDACVIELVRAAGREPARN